MTVAAAPSSADRSALPSGGRGAPKRPSAALVAVTVATVLVGAVIVGVGLLILAAVVLAVVALLATTTVVARVAHSLRPHRGARVQRVGRRRSRPVEVIETTATVTKGTGRPTRTT